MVVQKKLKFLDLFSGIGGFRLGMEQAGHECVGYCEIDKFARRSYRAMYNTKDEWNAEDIKSVTNAEWRNLNEKYGKIDVICGGFPCQTFSVAGNRKGFRDKTKGTLFFEIARSIEQIKPQYVLLENVKGILNIKSGKTFRTILSTFDELGYDVEWNVLNSKDYGVPQNRERVFIVGYRREGSARKVLLEEGSNTANPLTVKYFYNARKHSNFGTRDILYLDGISKTLETMTGGNRQPKIAIPDDHKHNIESVNGMLIRKLTPKECWRLQGFPDILFDKAKEVNSDSQLYKQAGNSVTVPVINWIAERMVIDDVEVREIA